MVQLKSFIQSSHQKLHTFTKLTCPLLIIEYLRRVRGGEDFGDLEGLLILISMSEASKTKDLTKRPLPMLQQSSVYHDAFLQGDMLTEKVNFENYRIFNQFFSRLSSFTLDFCFSKTGHKIVFA